MCLRNFLEEIKNFRHILRKDNELVHLLRHVTYVTVSDIRNFATNMQIYESFLISNKIPNNEIKIFINCKYF